MAKQKYSRINLRLGQVCIGVRNPECRRLPHSPNSLNRMHWGTKKAWKEAWEEEVGWAWQSVRQKYTAISHKLPYNKTILEIYVFTSRPMDKDNMYGSMKGVIDGVVKSGLVKDDSFDCLKTKTIVVPVNKREGEHIEMALWLDK